MWSKGVTFQDAAQCEPPAAVQPVLGNCRDCVLGTRGFEPARAAKKGRQQELIGVYDADANPGSPPHGHLDVFPDLHDCGGKIGIHDSKGRVKQGPSWNGNQIKSFESACANGVGFLVTEYFAQAPFRAVARHGVAELA